MQHTFFRLYHLPQGGSITLGSMLPILFMATYYGPEVGYLIGFFIRDRQLGLKSLYLTSGPSAV
ncbi:energy-coupled thiamine transporter ThiT [Sporomusa carbonis]|uniref:energy-coupled thiamine transporter ThiT n=1 Tax=Sporomusa carbonis TaxID=3076075 RepID=UPI003C7B5662